MTSHNRRDILAYGATFGIAALAGCSGSEDGGTGSSDTTNTDDSSGGGSEPTETEGGETAAYGWTDATWDSYWYSLYNMSTNISMSGNGVLFPHNEQQQQAFDERFPAMLEAAGEKRPPVNNPNLILKAKSS